MDNQKTLQTVERAISFLEFVASAPEPPSINDVSDSLGLNITTCYHLMRTLVARNYIERDKKGLLSLGEGVGALFKSYQHTSSIEQNLAHIVKRIATQTQETSFLSVREGDNVILKAMVEGSRRLRVAGLYVGLHGSEHRRASGKVILAHLDEKSREAMIEQSLTNISVSEKERKAIRKSLDKELPLIAKRGWSDDRQTEEGIIAIGAPIFHPSGAILGAMGLITPTFRMDKSDTNFINAVMAAAAEATHLLKEIDDQ